MSNQNEKRQDAFLPVEDDALDQISGGIVTSSVPLVNMSSLKRKEFDSAWEQMGYNQHLHAAEAGYDRPLGTGRFPRHRKAVPGQKQAVILIPGQDLALPPGDLLPASDRRGLLLAFSAAVIGRWPSNYTRKQALSRTVQFGRREQRLFFTAWAAGNEGKKAQGERAKDQIACPFPLYAVRDARLTGTDQWSCQEPFSRRKKEPGPYGFPGS